MVNLVLFVGGRMIDIIKTLFFKWKFRTHAQNQQMFWQDNLNK